MEKKNRITDETEPWKDQTGKAINIDQCISACYLAASLLLRDLEFNDKIKDNEHIRADYERARIIVNKMRENYERAKAVMENAGKRPKLIVPGKRN